MITSDTIYQVTNRSASVVGYSIPEISVRRIFEPGETKKIRHGELEKLSYQSGGARLMADYFLIKNEEAVQELDIHTEPEYYMTQENVVELINSGSLDAWLDCLDFAPAGVIEMIKRLSVEIPLTDYEKRKALKDKTGFDADAAIRHMEEEKAEDKEPVTEHKERRVKTEENAAPARRTEPKYKVISKG